MATPWVRGWRLLAALDEADQGPRTWMRRALLIDPDNLLMRGTTSAAPSRGRLATPRRRWGMLGPVLEQDTGRKVRSAPTDPDLARPARRSPLPGCMLVAAEAPGWRRPSRRMGRVRSEPVLGSVHAEERTRWIKKARACQRRWARFEHTSFQHRVWRPWVTSSPGRSWAPSPRGPAWGARPKAGFGRDAAGPGRSRSPCGGEPCDRRAKTAAWELKSADRARAESLRTADQ